MAEERAEHVISSCAWKANKTPFLYFVSISGHKSVSTLYFLLGSSLFYYLSPFHCVECARRVSKAGNICFPVMFLIISSIFLASLLLTYSNQTQWGLQQRGHFLISLPPDSPSIILTCWPTKCWCKRPVLYTGNTLVTSPICFVCLSLIAVSIPASWSLTGERKEAGGTSDWFLFWYLWSTVF